MDVISVLLGISLILFFGFFAEFIFKKFNIPYRIIEYPIIKKERPNREESLLQLGLSPYYKHVLNVGLFTLRKIRGLH